MNMSTLNITIGKSGKVTIEANGFSGGSCTEATKKLEQAIGGKAKRDLKSEYYEVDSTNTQTETLHW